MADTTSADASGLIATSDYKLNLLQLVTSDGQVIDIRGLMIELNLYDDIYSPVMTGDLTLGDALDLVSTYGIHGNEFLMLNIDKPSMNNPIIKTFRCYKIGNRTLSANGLQNYKINFCSEEMFISVQNLISKSYKGLRVDQMVNDLLMNKLKINPAKIAQVEQTSGMFDLIIPRMNPLAAVAWLAPRAFGPDKNLFLFFENRDGFNFVSYETLLKQPLYSTYTFDVKIEQDPSTNFNAFNVLNIVQDHDMLKAIRSGAFSSTIATYDIVNRTYNAINFNVRSLANNATLNGNLPANEFKNRLGQSVFDTTDNMVKFVLTTDSDPTTNPATIKKWLPQTISRLGQLNTFKIVGVIPGDIQVKAGMVIGVIIPKMEIQDKATKNSLLRSGNYLISSCHHKFIMDVSSTIIELLSDTVCAPLPAASGASPTLQQVIQS